jgi:hypothetical protein
MKNPNPDETLTLERTEDGVVRVDLPGYSRRRCHRSHAGRGRTADPGWHHASHCTARFCRCTGRGSGHRLTTARRRRAQPRASARAGERPRGGAIVPPPAVTSSHRCSAAVLSEKRGGRKRMAEVRGAASARHSSLPQVTRVAREEQKESEWS